MHTVRVVNVEKTAPDTVILSLEKPKDFTYMAGQFIVVQGIVGGKPQRRSYSLASAPHEDVLLLAVREQPQGVFSPFLCSLQPEDTLEILGPYGSFCLHDDTTDVVLIASGTGITPFRSFVQHLHHSDDSRSITVFVSNKTLQQELFTSEFCALAGGDRLAYLQTITRPDASSTWDGRVGRIDADFIRQHVKDSRKWFYICGSTPFVSAMQEVLVLMGIPKEAVITEKFGKIDA